MASIIKGFRKKTTRNFLKYYDRCYKNRELTPVDSADPILLATDLSPTEPKTILMSGKTFFELVMANIMPTKNNSSDSLTSNPLNLKN